MIFTYLDEIKKHAALIGFILFSIWLAILALFQMIFGWGAAGDSSPLPPSPDTLVATSNPRLPEPSDETQTENGSGDGQCLNIEGLIVCDGG